MYSVAGRKTRDTELSIQCQMLCNSCTQQQWKEHNTEVILLADCAKNTVRTAETLATNTKGVDNENPHKPRGSQKTSTIEGCIVFSMYMKPQGASHRLV